MRKRGEKESVKQKEVEREEVPQSPITSKFGILSPPTCNNKNKNRDNKNSS